jgi:hypothetical protein
MVHNGVEMALLADASEIGDSPLLRAMSSEVVDLDTLAGLVSVASYGTCLD